MKVAIIGGGTAGSEVAWQLRKKNKEIEISILEKGPFAQYSLCAMPYVVSGRIKSFEEIMVFPEKFYRQNNIFLSLNSTVTEINPKTKTVYYSKNNESHSINYDKLVIATGSKPFIPKIKGIEKSDFLTFYNLENAKKVKKLTEKKCRVAVIGAGYIGVELSHSLAEKGIEVLLIDSSHILSNNLDSRISENVKKFLEEKGVKVIENALIKEVNEKLLIEGKEINFDHLVLCCGATPNTLLAEKAGIACNKGISVNEFLETTEKDVFACGDCSNSLNLITKEKEPSMLATTAVRQARIIAKNILGEKKEFKGVLNASVSSIKGLEFGSVGIKEENALKKGIKTVSGVFSGYSKAEYCPEKKEITAKITADLTGVIIGCQITGIEISGMLDMASIAIKEKFSLEKFTETETCYNPCVSPIDKPIIIAAEICKKKLFLKKERSKNAVS